jgi:hypothetical protein
MRSYEQSLSLAGIPSLQQRRYELCVSFFRKIVSDPSCSLHKFLPQKVSNSTICLRRKRVFSIPVCKTNRFQNSFILLVEFPFIQIYSFQLLVFHYIGYYYLLISIYKLLLLLLGRLLYIYCKTLAIQF